MVRKDEMSWAEITAEADAASDAKREADAINARTAGWHFRLPDFATKGLVSNTDAVIDDTRHPQPRPQETAPAPASEPQAPRQ
jgi:hypothetical protein